MSNKKYFAPDKQPGDDADKMSPEIASVLRLLGYGMPKTEDEVAAAEARLATNKPTLPDSLLDLDAVFYGKTKNIIPMRPHFQDVTEASENLARAAREGSTISEEVEERMRADREKAERDQKDG